jgi:hypothetical protein
MSTVTIIGMITVASAIVALAIYWLGERSLRRELDQPMRSHQPGDWL